ncbi:MAG: sugar ABC transporter permease [Chloroflexi bacterium]|nr:sugar ABC transporter permease [Chloroflexota bacterium]
MEIAPATRMPSGWSRLGGAKVKRWIWAYFFISPWVLGFLIFTAYPMVFSAFLSFTTFDFLSAPEFVGTKQFNKMVNDELFWISLGNTAYYTFLSVPAQLVVALAMALALNQKLMGINIVRTMFYLPPVTPAVSSVILFVYMYNPDDGVFNWMLGLVGGPRISWLGDPNWSKPSLIIMSLWGVGGQMVIFLAGLQSVPVALQEAASIDGAGVLRRFWHVTVPMITPVIFFNLVLGIISSFQIFTAAYIATGGGPVNSTLFYVLWLYQHAFENFRMGYAATLGWVLLAIIMIFTGIQFYTGRRWVYYEGSIT